jgi:hypothetical protein
MAINRRSRRSAINYPNGAFSFFRQTARLIIFY